MANELTTPTVISDPALEMVMRDVLDSLCEYSLESGFQPMDGGFEIIEICPANKENGSDRKQCANDSADLEESEILEFPDLRQATG